MSSLFLHLLTAIHGLPPGKFESHVDHGTTPSFFTQYLHRAGAPSRLTGFLGLAQQAQGMPRLSLSALPWLTGAGSGAWFHRQTHPLAQCSQGKGWESSCSEIPATFHYQFLPPSHQSLSHSQVGGAGRLYSLPDPWVWVEVGFSRGNTSQFPRQTFLFGL